MANRNFDTSWCIGKRLIEICGSFQPLTGAGTITASLVKGLGFGYGPGAGGAAAGVMGLQAPPVRPGIKSVPGIVRASAGLYSCTLDDSYRDINFVSTDLAMPAAGIANWAAPVEPWTNTGVLGAAVGIAPTVQFLIVTSAGAPTDVAGLNTRLHFALQAEDSSVQFSKP